MDIINTYAFIYLSKRRLDAHRDHRNFDEADTIREMLANDHGVTIEQI